MKKIMLQKIGPIAYLEQNLDKQINIVIGQQSIGKSTLVKSIYFFRSVPNVFYTSLLKSAGKISFEDFIARLRANLSYSFLDIFGGKLRQNSIAKFNYTEEHFIFVNRFRDGTAGVEFSPSLYDEIHTIYEDFLVNLQYAENQSTPDRQMNKARCYNEAWIRLNHALREKQCIYIPAERSIVNYLVGEGMLFDIKTMPSSLTSNHELYAFMDHVRNAKDFFANAAAKDLAFTEINPEYKEKIGEAVALANKLKQQILHSSYVVVDDKDYLQLDSGEKLLLYQTSSGQQEIIWILNILEMLLCHNVNTCIIIEEPEANLFPNTQRLVMEFISLFANVTGSEIYITTHSPYMLASTNMLLYAGKYSDCADNVDAKLRIDPAKVNAIYMHKDGCKNILHDGEIDMQELDEASDIINATVDKIMARIPLDEEDEV